MEWFSNFVKDFQKIALRTLVWNYWCSLRDLYQFVPVASEELIWYVLGLGIVRKERAFSKFLRWIDRGADLITRVLSGVPFTSHGNNCNLLFIFSTKLSLSETTNGMCWHLQMSIYGC